ncbi:condensation domain-containing protein [Psychromonas sp. Urea-02u-13]|uniref:condensation domain-containing protein n=1 Tax=Psychromonas sp. Urea-02u-13 TaxID=2058326 RepID=UPI000C31B939|nr:condensation domain-containing protein [Psychromonas sp. Urea-02u-13]PKG40191.1 peptide synthetase [Psychromonas sp. Urea-02u-13]
MFNQQTEKKNLLPVSEYEEKIWMQQLQKPHSMEWVLAFYTLDSRCEIEYLEKAIHKFVMEDAQLNLRYCFTESYELEKQLITNGFPALEIKITERAALSGLAAALQKRDWQSESQAPFFATLLHTAEDLYLCLGLHPILNEIINKETLSSQLSSNYQLFNQEGEILILHPAEIVGVNTVEVSDSIDKIADTILTAFKESLNDPDVELDDDFFEMGGHSLLATRIIGNLVNAHNIEISFNDFFKSPTAQDLAKCASIKNTNAELKPATQGANVHSNPAMVDEKYPLSMAQSFLWDSHVATGMGAIFNLPFAIRFDGEVDEYVFKQAFTDLLLRHIGLRTLFVNHNSQVQQQVIDETQLGDYLWFWSSADTGAASLASEAAYVFDLSRELPLRIRFFKDQDTKQQTLSFLIHHMVIDEWSLNTLMPELSQAYMARLQGEEPIWDKPANTMHEYAVTQQRRGPRQEDLNYWVNHLQQATPGLTLLENKSLEDTNPTPNSIEAKWIELDLGKNAHNVVTALARKHSSSTFSVVYSAIAQALQRLGSLDELVIGTSASGRDDPKYYDAVGYFTTMVAHRVVFEPEQAFGRLIEHVTGTINESMVHATVPINLVQRKLEIPAENGLLFDVYVQIHAHNALYGALQKPQGHKVSYQQILPKKTESLFGLHFEIMENVVDEQRTLRLIVTYQTARYNKKQILKIGQAMRAALITDHVFESPTVETM